MSFSIPPLAAMTIATLALLPVQERAGPAGVEFHFSPTADLHQEVRALAGREGAEVPLEGLEEALAAAAKCDEAFAGTPAWSLVDGLLLQGDSISRLKPLAERLPPRRKFGEVEVSLREPVLAYLSALERFETPFVETLWPERKKRLEKMRTEVAELLAKAEPEALGHLLSALGFEEPSSPIPIYLVSAAPSPGGITLRTRSGPACVVSIAERTPVRLCEVILHEATHAVEARRPDAVNSAPAKLRVALKGKADAATIRNAWHTLFFLQAAETVRVCIDPEYVDYGVTSGYYQRVGRVAALERKIWKRHSAGEIDLAEALREIAEEVTSDRR